MASPKLLSGDDAGIMLSGASSSSLSILSKRIFKVKIQTKETGFFFFKVVFIDSFANVPDVLILVVRGGRKSCKNVYTLNLL